MHEETMSLNYCNTRNHINDLRYAKRVKKKMSDLQRSGMREIDFRRLKFFNQRNHINQFN